MAVDIYEELARLNTQLATLTVQAGSTTALLEARVAALEAATKPRMQIGAVSYGFPGPKWDGWLSEKPAVTAINPGSGPGAAISMSYVAQVARAKAAGAKVFGYTHTKYSARPIVEVKSDIDKHQGWYAVDGIFVDTTSVDPLKVPYYLELCDYIHSKGMLVTLNPGTRCPEALAQAADYVMAFEGYTNKYAAHTPAAWEAKYPEKVWVVLHECATEADMHAALTLMSSRKVKLAYITNDLMPNPYDTVPTFYSAFAAAVRAA